MKHPRTSPGLAPVKVTCGLEILVGVHPADKEMTDRVSVSLYKLTNTDKLGRANTHFSNLRASRGAPQEIRVSSSCPLICQFATAHYFYGRKVMQC
jgi:hypothetical protein